VPPKLAIVVSHPIQYWTPIYRALAADPEIRIKVFFASDKSVKGYIDPGFGVHVRWDIDLLAGYEYVFLDNRPLPLRPASFFEFRCVGLTKRFSEERFDAVMVTGYGQYLSWQAVVAANRLNIPVLMRGDTKDGAGATRGWLKTLLRNAVLRVWYRHISGALAIGKYMQIHYQQHRVADQRIFWTPHCVDNARWRSARDRLPEKIQLREQLGLSACKLVLLFCGKLQAQKNPLLLGQALKHIKRGLELGIIVVGEGEYRDQLERTLSGCGLGRIAFVGFKNQNELPLYYAASDVLVLPSQDETWGLVVNEAMNFSLPAIVSDHVGCANDLVLHDCTGLVFPSGDAAALASCINRFTDDPALARIMGKKAYDHVSRYSVEATADGIKQAVRYLTDNTGHAAESSRGGLRQPREADVGNGRR
jgi:glycosyltransferase involved in cell wall biosynthesis